ncbi:GGDEF domain-containing protein [Mesobacillus jeotgali]|uniref:GGDEF domain-containing protein n=1 Tax=Mesobacillus jeotgali TaxID=129985 RepID=UPI0021497D21|nr:diguanylate cyclase [Mesobacillus jeotgali]
MHNIIDIFTENMTLIIAFLYIGQKLKEVIILKIRDTSRMIWAVPVTISLLSLLVMHHPFFFEGMRIDLRSVPLFFVAFLTGWKLGIIAVILPLWYRIDLGGPTVIEGVTQSILLPYIVGSLFHRRITYNPPYTLLNVKYLLVGFLIYEIIKSSLMFLTTPVNLIPVLIMVVFEFIAILTIALINNDTNLNLLTKKELEFDSRHDGMTNLYNLRYFNTKAGELLSSNKSFVIGMIDVDYFKNYNDTHGHPAGDIVLKNIGKLLKDSMRDGDVFARYGGEEFIICLQQDNDISNTAIVADRFRNLVEAYPFHGEESQPNKKLTVSIGLSSVSNGKEIHELIEEADQALYAAKQQGRNTVHIYDKA